MKINLKPPQNRISKSKKTKTKTNKNPTRRKSQSHFILPNNELNKEKNDYH